VSSIDWDWTRVVFDDVFDPHGNNVEAVHRGEFPD
jgi:hypothetical protein